MDGSLLIFIQWSSASSNIYLHVKGLVEIVLSDPDSGVVLMFEKVTMNVYQP